MDMAHVQTYASQKRGVTMESVHTREPYRIALEPVQSSNIAAAGYDPERLVFAIKFKNGDIWHYGRVPPSRFQEFAAAESKGRFFSQHVRGKYAGEKMTGTCSECGVKGPIGVTCDDCGCGTFTATARPTTTA